MEWWMWAIIIVALSFISSWIGFIIGYKAGAEWVLDEWKKTLGGL